MLDYKKEYQRWLTSDALSAEEKAELQAISGDEKEIESRFYGPLEFGTAGLRGTMKVGLHQMNVHVIRWATRATRGTPMYRPPSTTVLPASCARARRPAFWPPPTASWTTTWCGVLSAP